MNKRYWIWLQMCLGAGAYFKEIIEEFGSIENLYNSNILEWKMSATLVKKQIEALGKYNIDDADKIISDCKNNNWDIITYDDARYPNRLREISNPPAVLYVDGSMPDIDDSVAIGIVGTRKASTYATNVAKVMAKGISLCGAIVVSGGALGVDSAAHEGALSVNAKTIAVLGNGFGADYLKANETLRNSIRKSGVLITEFPPMTPASKNTFPIRNRIISGLSLGLLVVEAGIKSGSLITAKYAYEQDRDIYSVPASIFDSNFLGTNKLIDDGATVATSPAILIERYANQYESIDLSKIKTVRELMEDRPSYDANTAPKEQVTFDRIVDDRRENVQRQKQAISLVGDERLVYEALADEFQHIDKLTESTSLPASKVTAALTMLEIKGLVESASGKRYRLK